MDISSRVAQGLLSIGAVFLRPQEPFTWASGIKSPIYCDNRLILTAPAVRETVERAIADTVHREFPQAEVLMGTATAGIAHAAIAAHLLGLPMGYVRSGSKDHGRKNQIEGRLEAGQRVVVIEDLISTGGSVLDTVAAVIAQRYPVFVRHHDIAYNQIKIYILYQLQRFNTISCLHHLKFIG